MTLDYWLRVSYEARAMKAEDVDTVQGRFADALVADETLRTQAEERLKRVNTGTIQKRDFVSRVISEVLTAALAKAKEST